MSYKRYLYGAAGGLYLLYASAVPPPANALELKRPGESLWNSVMGPPRAKQDRVFESFSVGSAYLGSLQTGDLVFFTSPQYETRPIKFIMNRLRRWANGLDGEHVGFILRHPDHDYPYVVERTRRGVQVTPFEDRILNTSCEDVMVRSLHMFRGAGFDRAALQFVEHEARQAQQSRIANAPNAAHKWLLDMCRHLVLAVQDATATRAAPTVRRAAGTISELRQEAEAKSRMKREGKAGGLRAGADDVDTDAALEAAAEAAARRNRETRTSASGGSSDREGSRGPGQGGSFATLAAGRSLTALDADAAYGERIMAQAQLAGSAAGGAGFVDTSSGGGGFVDGAELLPDAQGLHGELATVTRLLTRSYARIDNIHKSAADAMAEVVSGVKLGVDGARAGVDSGAKGGGWLPSWLGGGKGAAAATSTSTSTSSSLPGGGTDGAAAIAVGLDALAKLKDDVTALPMLEQRARFLEHRAGELLPQLATLVKREDTWQGWAISSPTAPLFDDAELVARFSMWMGVLPRPPFPAGAAAAATAASATAAAGAGAGAGTGEDAASVRAHEAALSVLKSDTPEVPYVQAAVPPALAGSSSGAPTAARRRRVDVAALSAFVDRYSVPHPHQFAPHSFRAASFVQLAGRAMLGQEQMIVTSGNLPPYEVR